MFGIGILHSRQTLASVALAATVLAGAAAVRFAVPAAAAPAPLAQRTAGDVTADWLPTVQIDDGVVWSQTVVGNTVYAGGNFSDARPSGAAQGASLTPRGNLLAYDITTGKLDTSFAPTLNGQVNVVAASPDGSRLYVGGAFTQAGTVGGTLVDRYRIAAYSTSTGQLVSSFAAHVDGQVSAIVVTDSTVYVGGTFGTANGVARSRLAAFSASNGSLLGWAPTADNNVKAMVLAPDGTHLIVGGAFSQINGATALGLASIDATDGSLLPFAVSSLFKDYAPEGAFDSLSTDGHAVYGTGFALSSPSNFEGVFAADPNSGALIWLADCHGDGYSTYPAADAVYVVSHQHDCSNSGGFLNYSAPDSWYRTTAFTKQATGVTGHDSTVGYANFAGKPSPSVVNWFPKLPAGTFTGQTQAAWSVSGNSDYVVEGGEFPKVNGIAQYGLARFGVPSVAPDKSGPVVAGSSDDPVITPMSNTTARLAWQTNWDRDDEDLTYSVYRQDKGATVPISRQVVTSQFWNRPETGYLDTGLTPGATYTYWVKVSDPSGNSQRSDDVSITMPTNQHELVSGQYSNTVLHDHPTDYWRLDQSGGSASYDRAGGNDLTLRSGVTSGASGAIVDGDAASTFRGTSSGFGAGTVASVAPGTFSEEIWFATSRTSSGSGGLLSFGSSASGNSSRYDHYLGLSNGRVSFRMYAGDFSTVTLTSPRTYSDRKFHQAVATFSPSTGMALYVDGALVASSNALVNSGNFSGYWRVGGDANSFFNGTLDEASVYATVLSAQQVQAHYAAANAPVATPPTPSFTATPDGLTVAVDASASTANQGTIASYAWDFGDGSTGSGVTNSHVYAAAGSYLIGLTVTGSNGGTATTSQTVTVSRPNQVPTASFTESCLSLACSFDGSASSDADGSIAKLSWDFGDGASATGTTAVHAYGAAGSYQVTLTATDDQGAAGSTTATITVTADQPPGPFAADSFARSVSGGWGSADSGGAWTITGGSAQFAVNGGAGAMTMKAPGTSPIALLNGVAATDLVEHVDMGINAAPTGKGVTLALLARHTSAGDYRLKLRLLPDGVVHLALSRVVGTAETVLKEVAISGITYAVGDMLTVKFSVIGRALSGKVWPVPGTEPANDQISAIDSTEALQGAGSVGVQSNLASDATTSPVVGNFDNLSAASSGN